MTKVEFS